MTLLTLFNLNSSPPSRPEFLLKAVITLGARNEDGRLVESVALPWYEIMSALTRDPEAAYRIEPRQWEEIIAGAYKSAGFDEVILTPRSGDFGRDVVATKFGIGSIRIFDQVKAYKPGHLVTADEVRSMLGVITGADNVSKGVVTTTSGFAPRIAEDPYLKKYLPFRLELKGKEQLLPWLQELAAKGRPGSPSAAS